ncbi:MAG TPA: hypothetical protein PLN85_03590 [archaeon]|jgi:hypothetical protein|nr:hypothetical protein [archaeon]
MENKRKEYIEFILKCTDSDNQLNRDFLETLTMFDLKNLYDYHKANNSNIEEETIDF